MKEITCYKTLRGHTLIKVLGTTALVLLMLVSIAGAVPAYITNYESNNISVIDTVTNKVTATVPVGAGPEGVAVSPDGQKVYVTNNDDNTTSVIDTATNTVTATVDVGSSPYGVAVSRMEKRYT
jgi:YVTN family beta-propeller protein